MTDVSGIRDRGQAVSTLDVARAKRMIARGTVSEG
jgi:hypothetical protein